MEKKLSIEEIKSRIQVVCICKGIKQGRICDAIQQGCDTVEKVNQKTGSGSGGCKATRCGPVIKRLVENGGLPLERPHAPPVEGDEEDQSF